PGHERHLLPPGPRFVALLRPPPPPAPLFPYTTLFRSTGPRRRRSDPVGHALPNENSGVRSRNCRSTANRDDPSNSSTWCRWCRRDRKSTRLNSSHVKISYAVFCLKKKKQTKV